MSAVDALLHQELPNSGLCSSRSASALRTAIKFAGTLSSVAPEQVVEAGDAIEQHSIGVVQYAN